MPRARILCIGAFALNKNACGVHLKPAGVFIVRPQKSNQAAIAKISFRGRIIVIKGTVNSMVRGKSAG